jgi:micrococcal nuclease
MTYEYRHVRVIRVIDGDSLEMEVDLGNRVTWRDNFRLHGIDAPERGQPGYVEASLHLAQLLRDGVARAETHKPDKFGRWLVDLHVSRMGGTQHVNSEMVFTGHAKEYHGGKK